jgi:hypothetical protein
MGTAFLPTADGSSLTTVSSAIEIAGNAVNENINAHNKIGKQNSKLPFLFIRPSFIYCVVNHHHFCHSRQAGILLIPP